MKKLIIFLLCFIAGYCMAQKPIVKNDTMYFDDSAVYVPEYDVVVRYLSRDGKIVDINTCKSGVYIKEASSKNMNFKMIEFYTKDEKREKQVKAGRNKQNQG